tara:strand:- start:62 stop:964 length:903 start_codon:yes stop_codon:yes gene_type:complete
MLKVRADTKPRYLKKGDEVIIVASSSFITEEESIVKGLKVLEDWGLICRPYDFIGRKWGYLAGNDEVRYKELYLQEPTNLITFARGGWGAARLLEREQVWKSGWLVGYSDISSILLSRLSAGFDGGIHGPLVSDLSKEPEWSKERLKAILFGNHIPPLHGESWHKGIAKGPLITTNLTVGSHLLGSRHLPNFQDAILILEDIGESPYRIDRMLTQWRLAGLMHQIAGLGFGSFQNCIDPSVSIKEDTFEIKEVLRERCFDLNIPILGELPLGHCCGNAALPMGRKAELNGDKGELTILDY